MKTFIVTPTSGINTYPWFCFGETIEEIQSKFPNCTVEEDV